MGEEFTLFPISWKRKLGKIKRRKEIGRFVQTAACQSLGGGGPLRTGRQRRDRIKLGGKREREKERKKRRKRGRERERERERTNERASERRGAGAVANRIVESVNLTGVRGPVASLTSLQETSLVVFFQFLSWLNWFITHLLDNLLLKWLLGRRNLFPYLCV